MRLVIHPLWLTSPLEIPVSGTCGFMVRWLRIGIRRGIEKQEVQSNQGKSGKWGKGQI